MTKILHVETPTFQARATFRKQGREWKCIKSTPAVDWMEVATLGIIQLWLERNQYKWRWEADPATASGEAAPGPAATISTPGV